MFTLQVEGDTPRPPSGASLSLLLFHLFGTLAARAINYCLKSSIGVMQYLSAPERVAQLITASGSAPHYTPTSVLEDTTQLIVSAWYCLNLRMQTCR